MQVLTLTDKIDSDGHLRLDVPTEFPEGNVEIALVINPNIQRKSEPKKYDFSDLAGKLTWQGNAVTNQRSLRDEW
ncbi:hypothetical protein WA1_07320 [Scytonema hofmannii PCC 7110]|uniref:Uncharacterized protein n=1 Tax=Scytonema hofmannii PCC 7110 TaxID=128403 RepID=A0A139WT71_9CYAN|nr:hypothetical protein [Scytonema hofmannii]KYC35619.1 hypothetical protein WA1_07320 [Scytonema hofmannii PCC 7110]